MDNLIGKKLDGRYQLEELIGSGGMPTSTKPPTFWKTALWR